MILEVQDFCQFCHVVKQCKQYQLVKICQDEHLACEKCFKLSVQKGICLKCLDEDIDQKLDNGLTWQSAKKHLIVKQNLPLLAQIDSLLNIKANSFIDKQLKTSIHGSIREDLESTNNNRISSIESRKEDIQNQIEEIKKQISLEYLACSKFNKMRRYDHQLIDFMGIVTVFLTFVIQLLYLALHYFEVFNSTQPMQTKIFFSIYAFSLWIALFLITFSDKWSYCGQKQQKKEQQKQQKKAKQLYKKYESIISRLFCTSLAPINFFIILISLLLIQSKRTKKDKLIQKYCLPIRNKKFLQRRFYYTLLLLPNAVFIFFWLTTFTYSYITPSLWQVYQSYMMDSISIFLSCLLFLILPDLDDRYKYQLKAYYGQKDKKETSEKERQQKSANVIVNQSSVNVIVNQSSANILP